MQDATYPANYFKESTVQLICYLAGSQPLFYPVKK